VRRRFGGLGEESQDTGTPRPSGDVCLEERREVFCGGRQRPYTLTKRGFTVSIVQNPTLSLADDVAVTKRTLAAQDGPAILVGHSYGGVVVTEAGNDPKVAGLVYVAAFAPDAGESVASLIQNPAPGAPVPPILEPQDGFLFLDKTRFAASFCLITRAGPPPRKLATNRERPPQRHCNSSGVTRSLFLRRGPLSQRGLRWSAIGGRLALADSRRRKVRVE
jgi:pimeloyl-ACP methyl ester carboxylesterase